MQRVPAAQLLLLQQAVCLRCTVLGRQLLRDQITPCEAQAVGDGKCLQQLHARLSAPAEECVMLLQYVASLNLALVPLQWE
jgi:hypothetical protein